MHFLASDSAVVSICGLGQDSSVVHSLPNVPKDLVKVFPMFQDVSVWATRTAWGCADSRSGAGSQS
jgi:hypothetical protein